MKPFSIWTRRYTPAIEINEVRHLEYRRDLMAFGRWVCSFDPDHKTILMRPYGMQSMRTYIADGHHTLDLPSFS